jgi:acetolactate synthase I/II/III large subunit
MNGAESLIRTLVGNGVDTCFANPGTSEMHFVSALDRTEGMRCLLGLFEGVATGAADGYARMLDQPAATLLHLGPGLANGLSNLHNAGRANSPVVNIVGDHATYHRRYDAPLTSDIEAAARPFSAWVRTSPNAETVAADGAAAIAAALSPPGRVATLILPADTAWSAVTGTGAAVAPLPSVSPPERPSQAAIDAAARILLSGETTAIVLAGPATREPALSLAGKIAAATGAKLCAQTHSPRITRGAGHVPVARIPYPIQQAIDLFKEVKNLMLIGGKAPVGFFAYPDKPSELFPPGTRVHTLARIEQDIPYALEALVDAVGAEGAEAQIASLDLPDRPTGSISPEKLGALIAATLTDDAIVVDESITTGRTFMSATETARPHDWILPTGGAIGFAMPVAVGAAVACPHRKVICLESDGSGMYMPQSLWTQAREELNVLTVVFANRKYQILRSEMANVGTSNIGPKASALLDLDRPTIDWVALAASFGVDARRAETMDELSRHIDAGLATDGPFLIEVVV